MKIWTVPNITMRSVHENKTILIHSLENLRRPCNHDLKFSQKYSRFNKVIWKFEPPLLSRAGTFAKMRQFCWTASIITSCYFCSKRQFWRCHLKFWTGPIFTSWHFCKTKAVFDDVTYNFEMPLLSRAEFFAKIS